MIARLPVFVAALLAAMVAHIPQSASQTAEPSQATSDASGRESRAVWGGQNFTVRVLRTERERHVEIRDRHNQRIAYERIPSTALSSARNLRITAQERPIKGSTSALDVRIEGEGFGGATSVYQLLFTAPHANPRLIWAGRHVTTGTGERLEIQDLHGKGKEQIVTYAQSPTVQFCGQEQAPLFPRVWNEHERTFELISLRPHLPANPQKLEVQREAPAQHWGVGAAWHGVSSDAGHRVLRSYGKAPERLWDHDLDTAWRTQGPDGGVGNFITAQINPAAALAGIHYALTKDPAYRPQQIALTTESATYLVDIPTSQQEGYIALPSVEATRCVTLSIVEASPKARGAGFAELHLYTGLDVGAPEEVFETQILAPYREAPNRIEQERIAQLLVIDDPRLAQGAVRMLQELDRDGQAPVIDALMRTENGRVALYQALQNTELSSSAIAALGRALRTNDPENIDALFDILDHTNKRNIEHSIIRILSRSISAKDAPRLIPYIESAPSTWRGDFVFGLAKIPKRDIHLLLHALNGSLVSDPVILRAATRIARREQALPLTLDPTSIAHLERALDHDNGTIARIAYELVGWLHVEALQPRLLLAFEDDTQSQIRLAAFRGLVHYATIQEPEDQGTSLLLRALRSDDPSMRIEAARQFRTRDLHNNEVDFILDALRQERWPEASRPLLTALIRQKDAAIDAKVAALLLKKDRSLLRTALVAWQSRSEPVAFDTLTSLVAEAQSSDSLLSNWVRAAGNVANEDAAQYLRAMFSETRTSDRIRAEILESLGRQRMDENIALLSAQLQNQEVAELRRAAARGLAWYTRHPEVKRDLKRAQLQEKEPAVQRSIAHALQAIYTAESARELLLREHPADELPLDAPTEKVPDDASEERDGTGAP